jgi:acyl-CoA hydrolase
MTPDMSNFSGKVHGGTILKLLDEAAFSCASRYCKTYVVTASLDQVVFKKPITVGDLVTFKCHVNYVGRSSMEIGIRVEGEKIREKTQYHAISCYFTMVSVDEDGKTLPVPRLQLDSEAEEKLFQAGKMRCAMRKEIQERNLKLHVGID